MGELTLLIAIVAALTLLVHLARQPLRHAPALLPLLGLLAGAAAGPYALGLLHPESWADSANTVVLWGARVVLAVVLTALCLALRLDLLSGQLRPILWPLLPALLVRWAVISVVSYFLTHFTLWGAILTGAALAPVDVVLVGSIATTPLAPRRLVGLVSAEGMLTAACMVPLVLLPLLMMVPPPQGVWLQWLLLGVLRHWLAGAACGAAIGYLLARFHLALRRGGEVNLTWLTVALALVLLCIAVLAQFAELAMVTAGALVYAGMTKSHREARRQNLIATVQEFMVLPAFALLGAALPLSGWQELGWQGLVAALVVVLLGRLPAMLMLRPELHLASLRETVVAAWLGPVGITGLYFLARVEDWADIPPLWQLGSLVVVLSTIATALGFWLNPAVAVPAAKPEAAPQPESTDTLSL